MLSYLLSAIPAIGVVGIWWSVPIGWGLADLAGLLYYKAKKQELLFRFNARTGKGSEHPTRTQAKRR